MSMHKKHLQVYNMVGMLIMMMNMSKVYHYKYSVSHKCAPGFVEIYLIDYVYIMCS